jgi:hypothetical protein
MLQLLPLGFSWLSKIKPRRRVPVPKPLEIFPKRRLIHRKRELAAEARARHE